MQVQENEQKTSDRERGSSSKKRKATWNTVTKTIVERSNVTFTYYQKLEKRKQIIVRSKCLLKFLPTIK